MMVRNITTTSRGEDVVKGRTTEAAIVVQPTGGTFVDAGEALVTRESPAAIDM